MTWPEPADPTAPPTPTSVGDLVQVRAHPTVVRLEHLDQAGSEWITSAYHLTPVITSHLAALEHALAQDRGCGMFLIGQYGAGKSHFLAYVTQRVRGRALGTRAPDVRTLSLVNFRGELALEEIVSGALELERRGGDRRESWDDLAERHPDGVLLVIDELSEFLRSKPDRRQFTEDVRFLQFLGEWASGRRFWVLCSMQEQIEHTGELDHGLYRKIKDRYPLRFLLTPGHVRELIEHGLLIRRSGFEEVVARQVKEIVAALPASPVDQDALRRLYPLHPATIDLLEEVRDRFSQARGVVDFVITQLAGDRARGIAPFLERPLGDLITPELIVDHFRDLLELQAEFLPLSQQLFPYYEKHVAELFDKPAAQVLAWRLVKLLVLVHLSPARTQLTAQEAAFFLLYRASTIDPQKNVQVLERMLKHLAESGRYIVAEKHGYRLSFADDGGLELDRFVEREVGELAERGEGAFEDLAPLLAGRFNPFALPRDQVQTRTLRWRFHERPYAACLTAEDPPPVKMLTVCVRLPWGEQRSSPGVFALVPRRLALERRHLELLALARARGRTWSDATRRKLESRLKEKLDAFEAEVRHAYLNGTLVDATGRSEPLPPAPGELSFEAWLEHQAALLFRRLYPAFERFAPAHGPLPKEALRRFVRFALHHDLCTEDGDDYVRLIREAYLVPMGLLVRQGRGYAVPKNLERNELVRLLRPLLDHGPNPKAVFEHLAQPIYGLVPDQVQVLLLFLLILGEIDILKEKKSYRELGEALPDPIHYDRIVQGQALAPPALQKLEVLCEGLAIRLPPAWTVLAQRQAIERLREKGNAFAAALQPLIFRLEDVEQGGGLARKLKRTIELWRVLDDGDDVLDAFERFLQQITTPGQFLAAVSEQRELPAHLDRLIGDVKRLRHLLASPSLAENADGELAVRIEALGAPPALEETEALDRWVRQAQVLYEQYKAAYRGAHDAWWGEHGKDAIFTWRPPAVAACRHLALEGELAQLGDLRSRAERLACAVLGDLEFQPLCRCGFTRRSGPLVAAIAQFAEVKERVESALRSFFAKEDVKRRVRAWGDAAAEAGEGSASYLRGKAPWPEVRDVTSFDRHLAGVELVKTLSAADLVGGIAGRTWDKRELLEHLRAQLQAVPQARVRIEAAEAVATQEELVRWCLEQALRHGVALPASLPRPVLELAGRAWQADWVSPAALAALDRLGLPDALVDRVLRGLIDGVVAWRGAREGAPLVRAAAELLKPSRTASAAELASLASLLYGSHARLAPIAGERWLARLEALAASPIPADVPPLPQVLEEHAGDQWLIVDALGIAWLEPLRATLLALLEAWRLERVSFARVPPETTTAACYRELVKQGVIKSFEKIDALDALLHERPEPFEALARLAAVELEIAWKKLARRFDAARPVLVFADHGFRIAPDGRGYVHGGASALERLVPVIELAVRA